MAAATIYKRLKSADSAKQGSVCEAACEDIEIWDALVIEVDALEVAGDTSGIRGPPRQRGAEAVHSPSCKC